MTRAFLLCLCLSLPLPAFAAACPGRVLLSCDTSPSRALTLCLEGETFHYRYGAKDKPDMALSVSAAQAQVTPWNGMGHDIWSELRFDNGPVSYIVWTNFSRAVEGKASAGVEVLEGDKSLARIACRAPHPGTDYPLFDEVMGDLGFCHQDSAWRRCR